MTVREPRVDGDYTPSLDALPLFFIWLRNKSRWQK